MKEISPACGVVAVSKAGRDAGKYFVILEVQDDQHVLIADGELRKVNKPKRKKLKHLWIRPYVVEFIQNCLQEKKILMDSDVRKALTVFEKADQKEEG
jgi:ribosomal protein L14E/L6E/L27E